VPTTYDIQDGVLVITLVGNPSLPEAHAAFSAGMAAYNELAPQPRRVLIDLCRSQENRSSGDLQAVGGRIGASVVSGRIAVVADEDLQFGQARVIEAETTLEFPEVRFEVFRERSAALVWLFRAGA